MEVWCLDIAIWQLQAPDHNTHVEVHLVAVLCVCSQECSRDQPFNPINSAASRRQTVGEKKTKLVECLISLLFKRIQKTGTFLEGRQSGEGWHRPRVKALVDACHPPLRFL